MFNLQRQALNWPLLCIFENRARFASPAPAGVNATASPMTAGGPADPGETEASGCDELRAGPLLRHRQRLANEPPGPLVMKPSGTAAAARDRPRALVARFPLTSRDGPTGSTSDERLEGASETLGTVSSSRTRGVRCAAC